MRDLAGKTKARIVGTSLLGLAMCSGSIPLLSGCDGTASLPPTASRRPEATKGAGFPKGVARHLGTIRAGEQRSHTFRITNETARDWAVREVRSTCSCTVAEASPARVGRGESLAVKVDYRAPSKTSEDARTVYIVVDDGDGSHEVAFRIAATIREVITVLPSSLPLDVSGAASPPATLQVENWSSTDWQSLRIESTVGWISRRARPLVLPARKGERTPRQAWQVDLSALPPARRLKDGNAREARLTFSSGGAGPSVETTVPVQLLGGERVRAVPSVLVLRDEAGGESSAARTVLTFWEDVTTFVARDVKIDHEPMPGLSFAWTAKSPREWELVARLATSAVPAGSPTKGSVVLTFPDDCFPPLKLPVYRPLPRDEASSAIQ